MKLKSYLFFFIIFAFLIACDSSGGSKSHKNKSSGNDTEITTDDYTEETPIENEPVEQEPVTDNQDFTEEQEIIVDNPVVSEDNIINEVIETTVDYIADVIIEDDEIPVIEENKKIMDTILFYDGSAKSYDGSNLIKLFDCVDLIKACDYYFAGDKVYNSEFEKVYDLPEKAIKACEYNGNIFYYTENNNLYQLNTENESDILIYRNTYPTHSVILNNNGIRTELKFFDSECNDYDGQFIGYDVIMKMEKIGSQYKKYWFNGSEFVEVGSGLYSQFARWHSLNINGIDYYTSGAIFDRANLKLIEPTFDSLIKEYKGGSAFIKFIQPDKITRDGINLNTIGRPHLIGIGVYNNNGYFLNAKDGKVYIFNPETNTITEWIKIIDGINSDDRPLSFELFDKTNAFIAGEYIIYFDGSKIQQVNIDTGEKKEIAEATNFKGYNK